MPYIALIQPWEALDYLAIINQINITILILVFFVSKRSELE